MWEKSRFSNPTVSNEARTTRSPASTRRLEAVKARRRSRSTFKARSPHPKPCHAEQSETPPTHSPYHPVTGNRLHRPKKSRQTSGTSRPHLASGGRGSAEPSPPSLLPIHLERRHAKDPHLRRQHNERRPPIAEPTQSNTSRTHHPPFTIHHSPITGNPPPPPPQRITSTPPQTTPPIPNPVMLSKAKQLWHTLLPAHSQQPNPQTPEPQAPTHTPPPFITLATFAPFCSKTSPPPPPTASIASK